MAPSSFPAKGQDHAKGTGPDTAIIGRIAIGKVVEKNGKRLPEKDDEFTPDQPDPGRDGWINHPFDEACGPAPQASCAALPVRLLFDDPELNFRAHYSLF